MAKVGRSKSSGKMACVSLFLVLLVAGSLVEQTAAQAAVPQFDWMGLLTGLLQNTFLGPFVTAINAVSGGVPNLSGALLGLTNNLSLATNRLTSDNGFGSSAASPAVFRRGINLNVSAAAAPGQQQHQAPKEVQFTAEAEHKAAEPAHDLYMEFDLPQQHHAARSEPASAGVNSSSPAFFNSPSYVFARNASGEHGELSARNAVAALNSTETLHARDMMNSSSGAVADDSALHPKDAEDFDSDDEATVSDAPSDDDQDDSAEYVNAPAVHARMVFKRAAVYNVSAPQELQARADPPAAINGLQGTNNLLAQGTNALGAFGAQQANLLGNLAANQFGQANQLGIDKVAATNAQFEADKAALAKLEAQKIAVLEAEKVAAKVPAKVPQGNEIAFAPVPPTTPKPLVYYTPSPKFPSPAKPVYVVHQQRPVYAAAGGKGC